MSLKTRKVTNVVRERVDRLIALRSPQASVLMRDVASMPGRTEPQLQRHGEMTRYGVRVVLDALLAHGRIVMIQGPRGRRFYPAGSRPGLAFEHAKRLALAEVGR